MKMYYSNEAEEKLEAIKSDIRYCRERIATIRSTLARTNVQLTHDRIQSSPNPNTMLDGIIHIIELENELSKLAKEGIEFIGQLDSEQMRKVCVLFYIQEYKVCDIAERMKYSRWHIYRLLREATVKLSEPN